MNEKNVSDKKKARLAKFEATYGTRLRERVEEVISVIEFMLGALLISAIIMFCFLYGKI